MKKDTTPIPCPWCDEHLTYVTDSADGHHDLSWIECSNPECDVRPRSKSEDNTTWTQGEGTRYHYAETREKLITAWAAAFPDAAYRERAKADNAPTAPVKDWAPGHGRRGAMWDALDALRWLLGWAQSWHRQSGGYLASDTSYGLDRCIALAEACPGCGTEREILGGGPCPLCTTFTRVDAGEATANAVISAGERGLKAGRTYERGLWRYACDARLSRGESAAAWMEDAELEEAEPAYRQKLEADGKRAVQELIRGGLMDRDEFERLYLNKPVASTAAQEELEPYAASTGTHHYPGTDDPADVFTSDCLHGCGCWMGPTRSGGPDGVDPFGVCPNEPKKED